jgi:hypothetical protein
MVHFSIPMIFQKYITIPISLYWRRHVNFTSNGNKQDTGHLKYPDTGKGNSSITIQAK